MIENQNSKTVDKNSIKPKEDKPNTAESLPEKKKCLTDIIDDDKNTQLHYAAAENDEKAALACIASGHKIDAENFLGWTPLMMAVRNEHHSMAKLLIKHKADASKRNKYGMNVFLLSVATGNLQMIEMILNHLLSGGVSKSSLQRQFSPVSMAVLYGQKHVISYLKKMGFSFNHSTPDLGITPYMLSTALESKEISQLLLEKGADSKLPNTLGMAAEEQMAARNNLVDKLMKEDNEKLQKAKEAELELNSQKHIEQGKVNEEQDQKYYPSPQIPLIVIGPMYPQPFNYMYPMQPSFPRRSSNLLSPLPASAISPLTPVTAPFGLTPMQYFFPPNFSPSHHLIPMNSMQSYNDPQMQNVFQPNDIPHVNQGSYSSNSPQCVYQY